MVMWWWCLYIWGLGVAKLTRQLTVNSLSDILHLSPPPPPRTPNPQLLNADQAEKKTWTLNTR